MGFSVPRALSILSSTQALQLACQLLLPSSCYFVVRGTSEVQRRETSKGRTQERKSTESQIKTKQHGKDANKQVHKHATDKEAMEKTTTWKSSKR